MNSQMPSKPLEILLIEDNPGDVRLLQEALKSCGVRHHLTVAADGEQAAAILQRTGEYREATRPHLIILDWNLPGLSGREVLALIKQDPVLATVPVVVFTTSQSPHDVREAYDLRTNCFITKPAHFRQFVQAVESIRDFWMTTASLPLD